jgi:hypothetical protein
LAKDVRLLESKEKAVEWAIEIARATLKATCNRPPLNSA